MQTFGDLTNDELRRIANDPDGTDGSRSTARAVLERRGAPMKWYVHKFEVRQEYGGPEEGGWWYDAGTPVEDWDVEAYDSEDEAYARSRVLNGEERERREGLRHGYSSVLSYTEEFFAYSVSLRARETSYPNSRPHYE